MFTMKYKFTKDDLINAINNSYSIANVCRILKIRPCGGNYKTLHQKIKQWNINISHFTGQGWNVGLKYKPIIHKKDIYKILTTKSYYQSFKLKERLFTENLKQRVCEKCNLSKWCNENIPLELHHINGVNTDNRLENINILCPNCHALTNTYRAKNKKKSALSEKRDVEYRKFKETLTDNADGNLEPSLSNKEGAETRHDIPKSKDMVKE